jgi:hypothetical protein
VVADTEVAEHLPDPDAKPRLADEVADVLIYLTGSRTCAGIDLSSEAHAKIVRNETRFLRWRDARARSCWDASVRRTGDNQCKRQLLHANRFPHLLRARHRDAGPAQQSWSYRHDTTYTREAAAALVRNWDGCARHSRGQRPVGLPLCLIRGSPHKPGVLPAGLKVGDYPRGAFVLALP